jgi:AdoMet-dependent rRNA methyltransferase SPB1
MSHAFHAQKRQEKYFKLAKQQGYRSRAAFKLVQLNKKYNFLSTARAAIDLCAAPGGWLQILSKYMPVSSLIIGVDILPIKTLPNVITFQEDITTQTCRAKLKKQLQGWQVDLVVHDGAPNVGGGSTWAKDAYVQNELVLHACKLACEFLSEGGTFVSKIFRSEDYMALTWVLKQFFKKVEVTKPIATREQSSEVFAVCTGYLAPKKIDPRIFDANYIFKLHREQHGAQSGSSSNKVLNVLHMKQNKRPGRDGYEDDQSLIHNKVATASQFLGDIDPNKVLAYFNQIKWDVDSQWAKEHELTNDEISHLFDDLKILSKGDFTRLIRWHKKMRAWKNAQNEINTSDDIIVDEESIDLTPEQLIANQQAAEEAELDALLQMREQHDKRLRKKAHEKKMKELNRLALNANNMAEPLYDEEEDELFRLGKIKSTDDLKMFKQAARNISKTGLDLGSLQDIITTRPDQHGSESEGDVEARIEEERAWEELTYEEQRERQVDTMYESYKKRKKIVTKRDKKAQAKIGPDGGVILDNDDDDDIETKADLEAPKKGRKNQQVVSDDDDDDYADSEDSDQDSKKKKQRGDKSDKNVSEVEKYLKDTHASNKLFKKGEKETNMDQANRWFSQDIFGDIDLDNAEERKLLAKHQKEMEKLRAQRIAATERKDKYFSGENVDQNSTKKRKKPTGGHEFDMNQFSEDDIEQNGDESDKSDEFYNSSDEFTETTTDESEDEYDPNAPFNSKKSRWAGTAEDREKDLQKRIDMQNKAEEFLYKQDQQNQQEMEVVAAQDEWTEYSDDSDARAEIIALGKKMIRKRSKNALIDATYNKYSWNDRESLPEWFAEDEAQHNVPQAPITKAEVMAVKNYYKAIDARPMQKVAEAKGRKKRGEMRRMERQKIHADNIMNQEGVSTEQKMKQLEKMQRRKGKTAKITKQYVMASRSGRNQATKVDKGTRGKVWTVRVDTRMKKDKQGAQRAEWRKKHGTRKK